MIKTYSAYDATKITDSAHDAKNGEAPFVFRFDAIGTRWEIETQEPLEASLKRRILDLTEEFDKTYSRFRPDSLVSKIATASKGGRFEFPEDSEALFDLYDRLYNATGGAVDPLVGRDLELLGYDQTYSLTPAPAFIRAAAYAHGKATWLNDVARNGLAIVTRRSVVIDVGAAGKGRLVDIISSMLFEAGFDHFVVDGSGDIRHSGKSSISIGLEHPFNTERVIGTVNVKNHALCASAINRRAWGNGLHHIIDGRTGAPVNDVVATWVIAEDAMTADGLATALFFVSAEDLKKDFCFSSVRMFADNRAEISRNFDGEIFS